MNRLRTRLMTFLLLAAAAIGLAAAHGSSPPERTAPELERLARCAARQHAELLHYRRCATQAAAAPDSRSDAALFRALALAAAIHEEQCAAAIRILGGHYRPCRHPATSPDDTTGPDDTNGPLPAEAGQAEPVGAIGAIGAIGQAGKIGPVENRYARRIMERIAAADRQNRQFAEAAAGRVSPDRSWEVCRACGTIHEAGSVGCCPCCCAPHDRSERSR